MLVLARHLNERIIIPCIDATVQVVGIQGSVVRLGIEAPQAVKVFREEVIPSARAAAGANDDRAEADDDVGKSLHRVVKALNRLRRQVGHQLPASTAAAFDAIDGALEELGRQIVEPAAQPEPVLSGAART